MRQVDLKRLRDILSKISWLITDLKEPEMDIEIKEWDKTILIELTIKKGVDNGDRS